VWYQANISSICEVIKCPDIDLFSLGLCTDYNEQISGITNILLLYQCHDWFLTSSKFH